MPLGLPEARFDADTEQEYHDWTDVHYRRMLRIVLCVGMVAYPANLVSDHLFDNARLDNLVAIRVTATAMLLAVFAFTWARRSFDPSPVTVVLALVASVANTGLGLNLPDASVFYTVAAQAITAQFMAMFVGRFRDLLLTGIILFAVPAAILLWVSGPSDDITAGSVLLATSAFGMVLIGYFVERWRRQYFGLTHELRHSATHDSLTGVFNRGRILECLENEVDRFARARRSASVLYIDIDLFKRINDHSGHAAGDEVLRSFAALVSRQARTIDRFGRLGGEEFLLVLPETDTDAARDVAERLRRAVEDFAFQVDGTRIPVTVSTGVATLRVGEDADALLSRADRALFAAKEGGRNRVELAAGTAARETGDGTPGAAAQGSRAAPAT
ncbi:MAG: GGDEF domain-containing protein [Hyphomicrobiales bacterium]|nr:GGDEF domain-containing protein [Hyphomicrobiales bacterium]MCP5370488.1 GGDEF domain-containing protein [Hyphomicrobiales bacterium]